MEITRQADYAIRSMIHLAELPMNGRVSTASISEAQGIPLPFLTKVISRLATAGLVTTSRGMGGGVSLARRPEEVTLLQVVEAVDGPILLNHCLLRSGACERESFCAAHDVWSEIQERFVSELSAVTMQDLALRQARKAAGEPAHSE
ncbi:MAG: Rrf2 family transcriptional regulator [Anaerolineales bacterium]|nr:MAG: Rrf2 family transcriptional regulator [Anaerolineales bacterium]